jgi:hypothetical protein
MRVPKASIRGRAGVIGRAAIVLLSVGLGLLVAAAALPRPADDIALGVTFSPRYATDLGLDPLQIYRRMLDELEVREIRLPVYWDEVEPEPGRYDFSGLEPYLYEAARRDARLIVSIGYKQPRWPECYEPGWAATLDVELKRAAILRLLRAKVEHLRAQPHIILWQVENEPFRHFGLCGDFAVLDVDFVRRETELVRSLDDRPVLITESGELSTWLDAMRLTDVFGSTMYRTIWFPSLGVWHYPLPAAHYRVKDRLVRTVLRKPGRTIIAELQAEAWFKSSHTLVEVAPAFQQRTFPATMLIDNVEYARKTGLSPIYLWGVEWWYWMEQQGYPEYVEAAWLLARRDR